MCHPADSPVHPQMPGLALGKEVVSAHVCACTDTAGRFPFPEPSAASLVNVLAYQLGSACMGGDGGGREQ